MPKKVKDTLRPYLFHGVDLNYEEDGNQATSECPFCGAEKFSVKIATSEFRCWSCDVVGNAKTFMTQLYDHSDRNTNDYEELARDRGLGSETLMHWGVARSIVSGNWLVPGYSAGRELSQVYKYTEGKKRLLLPTPTFGHGLHGLNWYNLDCEVVYLCEGPWDAMALWQALGKTKETQNGMIPTANREASMLSGACVLAVPGCDVFSDTWLPLFRGRSVCVMFDSDHPREHPKTGKFGEAAGFRATKKLVSRLRGADVPPSDTWYLRWGSQGYDPERPSGTDVRDVLRDGKVESLAGLLSMVEKAPAEWGKKSSSAEKGAEMECIPCQSYRRLVTAWKMALKWTDGLDHALVIMLASVASVKTVGDQLWIKVIGPAACGKSTLCEALSVNKEYIVAKSTIRGFHSGFRIDGGSEEDHSLASKLYDKTLITKDGDALLQSPNLPMILSEARDLYDCTSRTHYRNSVSKDYEGVRFTWLLCGTSSLRSIDQSELGERFLDCVIMEKIDTELENEVLWRVGNRAARNLSIEADKDTKRYHDPELDKAMQLTGGYVDHLRRHVAGAMVILETPEWAIKQCILLGKFVAYMRARPSFRQEETAEREFGARLVSQLVRLAGCVAFALNRTKVDGIVMARVKRVAMDTARGQTLLIALHLHRAGRDGSEFQALRLGVAGTEHNTKSLLRFLRKISVVEQFTSEQRGLKGRQKYRLTQQLQDLCDEVMEIT